jgi:hypothetical protein
VIPTNPQTALQTAVRGNLGALSSAYRGLSEAQRAAWTALGAQITRTDSLGEPYTLNGIQAYVSSNRNRYTTGLAVISDAPALPTIPTLTAFAVTAGA